MLSDSPPMEAMKDIRGCHDFSLLISYRYHEAVEGIIDESHSLESFELDTTGHS